MKRLLVLLLAISIIPAQLYLGSHSASAGGGGLLTLSDYTPVAGETVDVTGSGFATFQTYQMSTTIPGAPQYQNVTACFDAGFCTVGSFSYSFYVPFGTPPGVYQVQAYNTTSGVTVTQNFTVGGAPPPPFGNTISVSPTVVAPGQSFTIYGSGWTPGSVVCAGGLVGYISPCTDVAVDAFGNFSVSQIMPLSATPGSTITVRAYQEGSITTNASTTIQVGLTATFNLSVNPVQAGGTVTVTGTGFSPGTASASVVNSFGATIASQSAPVFGGTVSISISIPAGTPPGSYTVNVSNNGGQVGQTGLQVSGNPIISFSPGTGTPGSPVVVLGTGFPATGVNLQATFTLTTGATQTVQAFSPVSSSGTFSVNLNIPSGTASGTYTVTALPIGGFAPITSNVLPVQQAASIVASPNTLAAGLPVSVVGTGFGASEAVQIALSFNGTNYATQTGLAGPTGNFALSVAVPANAPNGAYSVTATGVSSHASAQATVNVTTAPVLSVNPTIAGPNTTVTLSGQNFAANSAVTLSGQIPVPGGSQPYSATAVTNAGGAFSTAASIPANAVAGTVTFTATQNQNGTTVSKSVAATIQSLSPGITFATNSVNAGGSVQISLSGFAPGPNALITISTTFTTQVPGGGTTVVPYSFNVDPNSGGNALTTLSVPVNATTGTVAVTATQASSGASTVSNLSVQAPAPPPTPTPTPTNTPIPTAVPPLAIESATVKWSTVREGTSNQVDLQLNESAGVSVKMTVSYPNGQTFTYGQRTIKSTAHYRKSFPIPANALNGRGKTALIHITATKGNQTVTKTLSFRLVP